jgi:hypothetical protein
MPIPDYQSKVGLLGGLHLAGPTSDHGVSTTVVAACETVELDRDELAEE